MRCTACINTNQTCHPKRLMHMHPRFRYYHRLPMIRVSLIDHCHSGSSFDGNTSQSQAHQIACPQPSQKQRQTPQSLPPRKATKAEENTSVNYNPDDLSRGKRKKLHGWARARDADPFGYTLPSFPAPAEERYFNAFVEREGLYGSVMKPLHRKQQEFGAKSQPVTRGFKIEFARETSKIGQPWLDLQHENDVATKAQPVAPWQQIEFVRGASPRDRPPKDLEGQKIQPTEISGMQSRGKKPQWEPHIHEQRSFDQKRNHPEASRTSKRAQSGFRPPPSNITAHASVSGLQRLGQYLQTAQDTTT